MLFGKNLLMSIPAALGVLCSLAAPAQSDTRQTLAPLPQHEPVTVAVPAEMPASMVAEIMGEAQSDLAPSSIQPPPERGGPSPAVLYTWKDHNAREILVRGDVMTKLIIKHGITVPDPVRVSTQWPDGRRSVVEGTSRVYWATLQHKVCSSRISCRTVDETLMKTVVDFRPYSYDGRTKGLVTSYCPDETSDRCPSWVNGVK